MYQENNDSNKKDNNSNRNNDNENIYNKEETLEIKDILNYSIYLPRNYLYKFSMTYFINRSKPFIFLDRILGRVYAYALLELVIFFATRLYLITQQNVIT